MKVNLEHNISFDRTRWRWYGLVALVIVAIQITIDRLMGEEAEFFNAYATMQTLTQWVHGYAPHNSMIYRQEQLSMWALPLATLVMIGAPFLLAVLLVQLFVHFRSSMKDEMHREKNPDCVTRQKSL